MSDNQPQPVDPMVIFVPSGRRGRVKAGTTLLEAANQMGVEIESICGGRLTCGKCKVRIEDGVFHKHAIVSRAEHVTQPDETEQELLNRITDNENRLSCSTCVLDDVLVYVPEESRALKQIIRKSAGERVIEILPAVRQVYVEVDTAQLGEHRGDWGRLQAALAEQWDLQNLSIDLPALRGLQGALRQRKWAVTAIIWQESQVIDVLSGYHEGIYGLAVDIGSTTVACYLCDLRTGQVLSTESTMNPQVAFGEDLMSRISYSMTRRDGLDKMQSAIIETLNSLSARAARQAGLQARQIHEAVIVGNTTMMHILLGINPIELGGAPFALANRDAMDIKARELGIRLHPGANIHIMPSQAGHVGADNVAVLTAEEPHHKEEMNLIVDVGTNAEIVLGNHEKLYSASSPTGPAFEGAQITFGMRAAPGAIERVRIDPESGEARFKVIGESEWSNNWNLGEEAPLEAQPKHRAAGICGSGIIEVVVEMFLAGIIRPDGRFNPECESQRLIWNGKKAEYILAHGEYTTTGEPITITQDDVRNIQLAKAALYAGAKLLMNRADIHKIDQIFLAGAFGSYIDPKHAMLLGLIPNCELDRVYAVGNAAGDGARIALLNREKRAEAQELARRVTYIETAVDPEFQEEFVSALHIPHAKDQFSNLEKLLPSTADVQKRHRQRKHARAREEVGS